MGKRNFECTPWGMPTFSIFGWQKPCYLLQDGYADTFQELLDSVEWENYGAKSGNPKCANCMVHSGHEASAVDYNFSSLKGFLVTAKKYIFPPMYEDEDGAEAAERVAQGAARAAGADRGCAQRKKLRSCRGFPVSSMTQEAAKPAQASADEMEIAAGREREQLEGWVPELAGEDEVREALEKAFDYRGDITVTRKDGSQVQGYLFDRRTGATLADSFVRIIPANEKTRLNIAYSEIAALAFTGRDNAAGKTLRCVGEEVLGEEGGGRKKYSDRAGEAGLGASLIKRQLLGV